MDQPGKVANTARGQLNRRNGGGGSCPRSRLRIWSRETDLAVPSRVSLLILHVQAESGAYVRDSSRFPRRRPFMYLNLHTPLGQFRVYRAITQLGNDAVNCRGSPGARPVVLKVVPATGALLAGHHGPSTRLSFPHPLLV